MRSPLLADGPGRPSGPCTSTVGITATTRPRHPASDAGDSPACTPTGGRGPIPAVRSLPALLLSDDPWYEIADPGGTRARPGPRPAQGTRYVAGGEDRHSAYDGHRKSQR